MAKGTNIIQEGGDAKHVIEGYHFKVMSEFEAPIKEEKNEETNKKEPKNEAKSEAKAELKSEAPPPAPAIQPEFVENILKKTDQMSDNIIKLQMQIEAQETEFNKRLESELANAKEKYTNEGYEKAKKAFDEELKDIKDRFLKSINKLDELSKNIEDDYTKNQAELSESALEIAKEVIAKEVDENSAKIALNLSKELIVELKAASSMEIKLSPTDFDYVKTNLQLKDSMKLSMDDAITPGSVIILSNIGNVQAGMKERLIKLTKLVNA